MAILENLLQNLNHLINLTRKELCDIPIPVMNINEVHSCTRQIQLKSKYAINVNVLINLK